MSDITIEEVFCQACNSVGFNINLTQASLLYRMKELVDHKQLALNLNDINLLVQQYTRKEDDAHEMALHEDEIINEPTQEEFDNAPMIDMPKYEEQDMD